MADSYAVTGIKVNGSTLIEVRSLALSKDGGKQEVRLLNRGFTGITKGGGNTELTIGFYMPKDGFEFDFDAAVDSEKFQEVQFIAGPHAWTAPGQFMNLEISQDTDSALEGTVNVKLKQRKSRRVT